MSGHKQRQTTRTSNSTGVLASSGWLSVNCLPEHVSDVRVRVCLNISLGALEVCLCVCTGTANCHRPRDRWHRQHLDVCWIQLYQLYVDFHLKVIIEATQPRPTKPTGPNEFFCRGPSLSASSSPFFPIFTPSVYKTAPHWLTSSNTVAAIEVCNRATKGAGLKKSVKSVKRVYSFLQGAALLELREETICARPALRLSKWL